MFVAMLVLAALAADPAQTTLGVAVELRLDLDPEPVAQVRMAFRRSSSGWESYPDPAPGPDAMGKLAGLPQRMRWTVCFDGKAVGSVKTKLVPSDRYARAGVHVPEAGEKIPFQGARSTEFAGWGGDQVHRPLALSATGSCTDPAGWHRAPVPGEVLNALLAAMRESVKVDWCNKEGRWSPWRYQNTDVEVLKTYGSKDGEWLAMLRIKIPPRPNAEGCDVVLGDNWGVQLFYRDAAGSVQRLGASMTVVDAGDYDGDGRSELLAKFERYNNDGYTLFWDGFRRQASFGWNYH